MTIPQMRPHKNGTRQLPLLCTLLAAVLTVFWNFAGPGQSGTASAQGGTATNILHGDWPRHFETADGGTMIMHQPQVTEWQGFKKLTALIASEYRAKGSKDEAFGVIGITANTSVDREDDEVVLTDIEVTSVNFSTLSREALTSAAVKVGSLLPTAPLTVSLTRLSASLSDYKRLQDTKGLATTTPPIFVSEQPAILLQTNGALTTAPVKGTDGLEFVVNTNWDLLVTGKPKTYYLRDETSWLAASDIKGPWKPVEQLPAALSHLPKDDNWKQANAAIPPHLFQAGQAPAVFYSDKPAELIVIKGAPKLQAIPNMKLEWVSNANTDLFFDPANKNWYFLTSGRWFKATDLQGSWTFASGSLPEDFRLIPGGEPYSIVRASVPGTSESDEARLKATIPTKARIDRKKVTVKVTYYGPPKFVRIKGTDLEYAVNTNYTVIRVGAKYYVLYKGVWFVGNTPNGPFVPADTVPADIYKMPPTSPVYNATYVRVYESTPQYVVYGYTGGYLWGYAAWGTFVYGTGWYYPPYWGYRPGWPPVYRPWHVTYGSGTYYLPGRGTFNAHWGRAYGPYGGVAAGGIYNKNTGGYVRGGAAWGPYNQGAYAAVRGPDGNVYRAGVIDGHVYKSWDNNGVTRTNSLVKSNSGPGAANRWQSRSGTNAFGQRAQKHDLFGNKDGQVLRYGNGQWQHYGKDGWQSVGQSQKKLRSAPKQPSSSKAQNRRSAQQNLHQSLDSQRFSRQLGNERFATRREAFRSGGFQRPTTRRFHGRR